MGTQNSQTKVSSLGRITKTVGMALCALYFMPQANAQEAASSTASSAVSTPASTAVVSPFKQCAAKENVTLPAKGSGQRLSDSERGAIFSCMKQERKEAFKACVASDNITLPAKGSGEKLTPAQHKALRSCMVAKGFKKHRHHRSQPNQESSESNS